jgi:hypothetical protein
VPPPAQSSSTFNSTSFGPTSSSSPIFEQAQAEFAKETNTTGATTATFSVVHKASSSKTPTDEQRRTVRLHVKQTGAPMNMANIYDMAQPAVAERLRYCMRCVEQPQSLGMKPSSTVRASNYMRAHADQLIGAGILRVVTDDMLRDRPTRGDGLMFVVLELDSDGNERLRSICYPETLNNFLTPEVYTAQLPQLGHPAKFADAVREEIAAEGDLAMAFHQVPLSEEASTWHRVRDDSGRLLEWRRLGMGNRPACEIMQLITEIISGVPARVKPEFAVHNVVHQQYVDGFVVSGNDAEVRAAEQKISNNSIRVGAAWKKPGTRVSKHVTFIGGERDHQAHTIRVAAKTRAKMPLELPKRMQARELVALTSRLIWATGLLRIPLARFYLCIKWANRKANQLNRDFVSKKDGRHIRSETIEVPAGIRAMFNTWLVLARKERYFAPGGEPDVKAQRHDTLFVDASTSWGWGCYFFGADGSIAVYGAPWPEGTDTSNISRLEALGTRLSLEAFRERLAGNKNVDIRIDNTSVVAAMTRGLARSQNVNNELIGALEYLAENDFTYTVAYVKSKDNWADAPSRGKRAYLPVRRGDIMRCNMNRGEMPVPDGNRGSAGRSSRM